MHAPAITPGQRVDMRLHALQQRPAVKGVAVGVHEDAAGNLRMPHERVADDVHFVRRGELHERVEPRPLPAHAVGAQHTPLHRVLRGHGVEFVRNQLEVLGDGRVQRLIADGHAHTERVAPGIGQARLLRGAGDRAQARERQAQGHGRPVA